MSCSQTTSRIWCNIAWQSCSAEICLVQHGHLAVVPACSLALLHCITSVPSTCYLACTKKYDVYAMFPDCLTVRSLLLQVDPQGKQWNRLRSSIGQPQFTGADAATSPAGAGV